MMNFQQVQRLQKEIGIQDMQRDINNGLVWKLEGSVGREAMRLLESGACMLPKSSCRDYYGNFVPSRDMLKAGTKGTWLNSRKFYENYLENGDYLDYAN